MVAVKAWGILDSGTTSHFLTTAAPITNMRPDGKPIVACLPHDKRMHSTHTCRRNIPGLPATAQHTHIIHSLASHSLISAMALCNAGCNVAFTKIDAQSCIAAK